MADKEIKYEIHLCTNINNKMAKLKCLHEKIKKVKDLGVFIDSKLSYEYRIIQKVKAFSILGHITRNFAPVGK